MNVIFSSGQNYTYYGNTRKGWCNEGCFTLSSFAPTEESCFGTGLVHLSLYTSPTKILGHLFPYQHTMDEAVNVLVDETEKHFALDEGVLLTPSSQNKYRLLFTSPRVSAVIISFSLQ